MKRYRPKSKEEIEKYIEQLRWEARDGGSGVTNCVECNAHNHFVIEGASDDGEVHVGYCLNPDCGYQIDMDEANAGMLDRRLRRERN